MLLTETALYRDGIFDFAVYSTFTMTREWEKKDSPGIFQDRKNVATSRDCTSN